MRQGETGAEMFIVATGSVRIERNGRHVRDAGPGTAIGEMALLSEGPRTATVTAAEPTRILLAAHREFHQLMEQHPTIRLRHPQRHGSEDPACSTRPGRTDPRETLASARAHLGY